MLYCTANKLTIDRKVRDVLDRQHVAYTRYFTTPAPLQNWLWYVVAGNDEGYYVGYRSLFDRDTAMSFQYFPRNEYLLEPIHDQENIQQLKRFSQQFYTVERWTDTLVLNDLRFGQVIGWQNPREKFAFHFFVERPDDNRMVVQRGRFAKWDREAVLVLWQRIKGN